MSSTRASIKVERGLVHLVSTQRRKGAKPQSPRADMTGHFRRSFAPLRLCAFALNSVAALLWAAAVVAAPAEWQPAKAPLMTRWAKEVSAANVLSDYPRPQMVRSNWLNLNGIWDFALTERNKSKPGKFSRRILVPFPVESALSGVMSNVTQNDELWYHRTFELPATWPADEGTRFLLHLGAADWETTVFINGHEIGTHRGGYDPFTFDITTALKRGAQNEIVISVWDPTDASPNSRGKQVRKPDQGIFYTATSGIWQTVWLEPVPFAGIASLTLMPDVDASLLRIRATSLLPEKIRQVSHPTVEAVVLDGDSEVGRTTGIDGGELTVQINNPKLWTPESPFLYRLKVAFLKVPFRQRTPVGTVVHHQREPLVELDALLWAKTRRGSPAFSSTTNRTLCSARSTRDSGRMAFTPRQPTKRSVPTSRSPNSSASTWRANM